MIVTRAVKEANSDSAIRRCFAAMSELRPHISSADEFLERVRRQQREVGYRLIYVEDDNGEPAAVSGFRFLEFLYSGRMLYVDDLVTREERRGNGYAEVLMSWMEELARRENCDEFHLDSGTQRLGAHRFYHRLKLGIIAYHFAKKLK